MENQRLKQILNSINLLKFVRKHTADNLLENNDLAKTFGVKTSENSISILDGNANKLFVSQARFDGTEADLI